MEESKVVEAAEVDRGIVEAEYLPAKLPNDMSHGEEQSVAAPASPEGFGVVRSHDMPVQDKYGGNVLAERWGTS